ncbi:hypothetical protein HAX54_028571, partial [Datura stramonium]|nr:hypothetical protein [Datura stramonium]
TISKQFINSSKADMEIEKNSSLSRDGNLAHSSEHMDMQTCENITASNNNSCPNSIQPTYNQYHSSPYKDMQSSLALTHHISYSPSNISHVKGNNLTPSENQTSSSKSSDKSPFPNNEQHPTNSSSNCPTPSGLCNTTSTPRPSAPIIGGTGPSMPSCHIHDGTQWGGNNDNTPKSEFSSSINNKRHETSNEKLCQPHVDDKCVGPSSPRNISSLIRLFHVMQTLLEPSTSLQPSNSHDQLDPNVVLHSPRSYPQQSFVLSLDPLPVHQGQPIMI